MPETINRALKRRWGKPATSAAENCMFPQCLMSGRLSSGKGVGRTVGRQDGKTVQKTVVYKRRKRWFVELKEEMKRWQVRVSRGKRLQRGEGRSSWGGGLS